METAFYTTLIKDTISAIDSIGDSDYLQEKQITAELYGIYYASMAGELRNKQQFRKEMGKDGYQNISVSVGSSIYSVRSEVLLDILGDDFERLTLYPYDDTSASYVKKYTPAAKEPLTDAEPQQDGQPQQEKTKGSGKKNPKTKKEKSPKQTEEMTEKQAQALAKAKIAELNKAAQKVKYDPNYDHYYSERLPEILKKMDDNTPVIIARIICIAVCGVGIAASMLLI